MTSTVRPALCPVFLSGMKNAGGITALPSMHKYIRCEAPITDALL